ARLRHRRPDPCRPGAVVNQDLDEQSQEDPRPGGVWAVGHRAGADRARAQPAQRGVPADQGDADGAHSASPGAGAGRADGPRRADPRPGAGMSGYAIVVGRFYEDLAERLIAGAQRVFGEAGVGEADVFSVPGAYELPLAALSVAETGRYLGVACLGAVIPGGATPHGYRRDQSA